MPLQVPAKACHERAKKDRYEALTAGIGQK